jgi:peptide-methionine (S)-S-oxide reductase
MVPRPAHTVTAASLAPALAVLVFVLLACPAPAVHSATKAPAPAGAARPDTALFAGGCFWCLETQFESFPGVKSVVSGYTGGHKAKPTYEEVGAHKTGHLEAVRVVFDPAVTSYAALLDRFWHGIDPTQADGQFCDRGETYRSAVFFRNEAQKRAALDSRAALERSGVLKAPIVTEIRAASVFWPAEEYHQDYWKKDPAGYRSYRAGCGRDARLAQLWGAKAVKPLVH